MSKIISKLLLYDRDRFRWVKINSKGTIRWAEWCKDGRILLVGNKGSLLITDINLSNSMNVDIKVKENLRCISLNPRNNMAIAVGNNGIIITLDLYNLQSRIVDVGIKENLRRVSWHPSGDFSLIVGNMGTCLMFDGEKYDKIEGAENNLRSISWHPSGKYAVITASRYRQTYAGLAPSATVYVYHEGDERLTPLDYGEPVDLIDSCWGEEDVCIAVGYNLVWHESRIIELSSYNVKELNVREPGVYPTCVAWLRSKKVWLVATGGPDVGVGTGYVYWYGKGKLLKVLDAGYYHFSCARSSPDGSMVILCGSRSSRAYTV